MQEWNGIRVGDIITAYNSGWHRLLEIVPRERFAPLFKYQRVVYENGNKCKRRDINECDASFCKKVTIDDIDFVYDREVEAIARKHSNLVDAILQKN